jgi:hypothetical protein
MKRNATSTVFVVHWDTNQTIPVGEAEIILVLALIQRLTDSMIETDNYDQMAGSAEPTAAMMSTNTGE